MSCKFSDLACENFKSTEKAAQKQCKTNIFFERISDKIERQTFTFTDGDNKKSTVYFIPPLTEISDIDFDHSKALLSSNIRALIDECSDIKNDAFSILTVGLGNPIFSTDSLGPETVKNIKTTSINAKKKAVYSVIPNVEINTGIPSASHILALSQGLRPDVVIVVDSLAAGSIERLASTVQISNYGLAPGSGLGRTRQRIDKDLLGIPVISIGIPTVVDLSAVISNEKSADIEKKYFVTPNEIELVIKAGSILLSDAINSAIWGN